MFRSLALGLSLSLFSLSAWAFPETIDVSGIALGSDMQEALAELQERYPNETPTFQVGEDESEPRIVLEHDGNREWEIGSLPDGSGRIGMITRIQNFDDDENVGVKATLEALRNKYGQESFVDDEDISNFERNDKLHWFWADATENFQIDDAHELFWYSLSLYDDGVLRQEETENARAVMRVMITPMQDGNLVRKMEITVYWVEPLHDHAFAYFEEQREKSEAELQRRMDEAENNPADI